MNPLATLSAEDRAALERLRDATPAMLARTLAWAGVNTGSHNLAGLRALGPVIADAFAALDADVTMEKGDAVPVVNNQGTLEYRETADIIRVRARPRAPVQVVMSGHYDTVFPPGTFETIREVSPGVWNGPGVCDMKGGIALMREALMAFEAGPFKDRLGYQIVLTPDEEIGNFASARALTDAARSGALIGMTYEPCLDNGDLAGGRKGSAVFDIVLHGRAAHAGRAKEDGRSAIEAAAALVTALEAINGRRDGVSVNVGAIDGGAPVNIVPDLAIVRFGARAPDADAARWCTDEITRYFEQAVARDGICGHLHGGFYRGPKPRNAAQEALFAAVHGTGLALGLDLNFIDTGGVCEGNNIFAAGVPNVDSLGVRGGRIHSDEEFLIVDGLAERAGLSALLLNRLADGRIDAAAIKSLMEG